PAAWKKTDQIEITRSLDLLRLKVFNHWMTDKNRAQTRFAVEIGLKRKNAEHQIDQARHLLDPAPIPCPDLWANVVDGFRVLQLLAERTGESQIKAGIVDQNDCVRFAYRNFAKSLMELRPKVAVLSQYFPQTKNRRLTNPIFKLCAVDLPHSRTAAPDEL